MLKNRLHLEFYTPELKKGYFYLIVTNYNHIFNLFQLYFLIYRHKYEIFSLLVTDILQP